jgi:hypothetical protein
MLELFFLTYFLLLQVKEDRPGSQVGLSYFMSLIFHLDWFSFVSLFSHLDKSLFSHFSLTWIPQYFSFFY